MQTPPPPPPPTHPQIPLLTPSDQVRQQTFEDIESRTDLTPTDLPSCCFFTLTNTRQSCCCLAFDPAAKTVAAGFADSTVRLFNLQSLGGVRRLQAKAAQRRADGRKAAAARRLQEGAVADGMEIEGEDEPEEEVGLGVFKFSVGVWVESCPLTCKHKGFPTNLVVQKTTQPNLTQTTPPHPPGGAGGPVRPRPPLPLRPHRPHHIPRLHPRRPAAALRLGRRDAARLEPGAAAGAGGVQGARVSGVVRRGVPAGGLLWQRGGGSDGADMGDGDQLAAAADSGGWVGLGLGWGGCEGLGGGALVTAYMWSLLCTQMMH